MNVTELLINDKEQVLLEDVFLNQANRLKLAQLLKEHYYTDELTKYGLPLNNKILLHGSSGCGKTMTAKAIAKALGKNLFILDLSSVISARIGETSQHLKQVFDKVAKDKAVLFLDEFDQIGKARGSDEKDVGEMRRLVNTLIQLMDYFSEKALLICATNHPEIIDTALIRRFQLKIDFEMPNQQTLDSYYEHILSRFPKEFQLIERKYDISFAEAKDYALTLVKSRLINTLEEKKILSGIE
ncbi:AAA family ATPase [Pedobacter xixiisoli]|uniref:ATPase family associated with various cellular activities (AAA) n=1 Tax=Pedobacter xixiisoli TaxID=1476464 RepID=A0A285ZPK6_9SPHI|nr:ATP-binding protein [Pedobacter xixiisoli]SOD11596.1 ATPase family associated with various cellular activities (AAA) [Pedobacter xixiisoli]